jgi:hypothetical protein
MPSDTPDLTTKTPDRYYTKPAKNVEPGDWVLIPGVAEFVVRNRPTFVLDKDGDRCAYVLLLEGRTRLGRTASGIVYQPDHGVLCRR